MLDAVLHLERKSYQVPNMLVPPAPETIEPSNIITNPWKALAVATIAGKDPIDKPRKGTKLAQQLANFRLAMICFGHLGEVKQ